MRNPKYINNLGDKATERIIGFCFPGLSCKAVIGNLRHGDVSIPNLRKKFEIENEKCKMYNSFEEFIEALEMFIPGKLKQEGIYTNVWYHNFVFHDTIKSIL